MSTWQEIVPERLHPEFDVLVRAAMNLAQERLSVSGRLGHGLIATDLEANLLVEHEGALAPSGTVTGRLYREPHVFRAVAVLTKARGDDGDVVTVRIEHCDGVAIEITARYGVVGLCGGVAMGQIRSRTVDPEVWARELAGTV